MFDVKNSNDVISVRDLDFSYKKSNKKALNNLNFNIEKGEIFGFLGPSGAGKTTTQRLIIGLLRHYEGHINILGKERREWHKDFYERIGVAFDFPNLYIKLTGKENLNLIREYYNNKLDNVDKLLKRVDLYKDKDKKVESYSKGMKMRLNFIRSILHEPELMFFDEPTSGLDPLNAKIIKELILEQKAQGKTIFLTTHNMTVAEQLCDRVAFIVEGSIPVVDNPKALMLKHGEGVVNIEYIENEKTKVREFDIASLRNNEEFLHIINYSKIKTIHSKEATLEDVFIKLTGKNLV